MLVTEYTNKELTGIRSEIVRQIKKQHPKGSGKPVINPGWVLQLSNLTTTLAVKYLDENGLVQFHGIVL